MFTGVEQCYIMTMLANKIDELKRYKETINWLNDAGKTVARLNKEIEQLKVMYNKFDAME